MPFIVFINSITPLNGFFPCIIYMLIKKGTDFHKYYKRSLRGEILAIKHNLKTSKRN
jgi:hypothetical protein